jgi:AmiR/NasT family two-component response regulator
VYEFEKGLTRASATAVFTFPLSGMMCLPMLMYTYKIFEEILGNQLVTELKKIKEKIKQNMPSRDGLML